MKPPTHTQKLLFDARRWTPRTIRAWIASQPKSKGYTSAKIHLLAKDYHVRQRDPEDFVPGSFRTIPFGDVEKTGIQDVIGHLKSEAKCPCGRRATHEVTNPTREARSVKRGLWCDKCDPGWTRRMR